MKHILYSAFLLVCFHSFSQNINLNLQYSFGGSGTDDLVKTIRLSNGNYVLIGTSNSPVSGTKNEGAYGGTDCWIVCLDANYTELWQKTIGGTFDEYISGVKELSNGDLLIFGFSNSSNTGNKQSVNYGSNDYWLVRMSNSGTILWDKTYGGNGLDNASNVLELGGGNLLVTGFSGSGISGNKTLASFGQQDAWVLKLSPNGTIVNQAVFGGLLYDGGDLLFQSGNNEFIIVGSSSSGVSGNKTESNLGDLDTWMIKIDSSFAILSQKVIGGSLDDFPISFLRLNSGNFLLTNISISDAGGMKTENSYGGNDAWLVELTPNFTVVRDKTIGGNLDEYVPNSYQLANGKILILLNSASSSNTYKSENSIGQNDFWPVVLDENWNVVYENTIGSTGNDGITDMIQKNNGDVVFFGTSNGGINNDKTCNTNGQNDFWVVTAQTDLSVNSNALSTESIYPNPTGSSIRFKTTGMNNNPYQVTDISGKVILQGTVINEQIDLSELHSGTYFIHINANQYKVVKL